MRLAVFSDIHGNLLALRAILADARAQGASAFITAGDLVARAPYPLETMALLQEIGALMIRGNADQYQIDYDLHRKERGNQRGPAFDVVRWIDQTIGEHGVRWLESLPKEMVVALPGMPPIRVVHGSPGNLNRGLVPGDAETLRVFRTAGLWRSEDPPAPLAQQLNGAAESLIICAHTHIPWRETVAGRVVFNPGGGGIPVNGDPRAQYALVNWSGEQWQIEHRAVTYDTAALKAAYRDSGLLEQGGPFARACMLNTLTGRNAAMFLILLARQYEQQTENFNEAMELAAKAFPWDEYEAE